MYFECFVCVFIANILSRYVHFMRKQLKKKNTLIFYSYDELRSVNTHKNSCLQNIYHLKTVATSP